MQKSSLSRRTLLAAGGVGLLGMTGLALWQTNAAASGDTASASTGGSGQPTAATGTASAFWGKQLHTVSLTIPEDDFQAMLTTYLSSQEKEWISGTVQIDGQRYEQAGLRLKGNSSLKAISADSTIESLPWKVSLDKTVAGAQHAGISTFVIRSNSSASALNEAVALELLGTAGLPTGGASYLSLSANGSTPTLRLAVESLEDDWAARAFTTSGVLYKAEAGGDYSYRGTEASAYQDVFDVEAGPDNLAPLTSFLDFLNNSSDADFVSQLPTRLNVDAFATYLAFQSLIDNFDDIDGPGNNSYLWWAEPSDQMTVVAWDHNLAFGQRPDGRGRAAAGTDTPGTDAAGADTTGTDAERLDAAGTDTSGRDARTRPAGGPPPGQPGLGTPGGRGGMGGTPNVLVTRFNALAGGTEATNAAKTALSTQLIASGKATQILQSWVDLLTTQAGSLITATTVASEAAAIAGYFD